MVTLCPNSGTLMGPPGTQTLPASPNTASLSASPTSGYTSPGSPSTTATSTAATALPSNEEVEAVIKQATSTRPTPDGRPPPGKDTRTQLFTGNLPYRVRWQDLKDLFRRAGTVLRADVSLSPDNRSRGYGTVLLASAEDAGRAVDMFNGYSWQGRVLEVRLDRLGVIPGAEFDAGAVAVVPGALPMGVNVNGVNVNLSGMGVSALNGLHVPSPHPALPFIPQHHTGNGQNLGVNLAPPAATSSLSAVLAGALSPASPLNTLNPALVTLQQRQQQTQQDREREEFLMNQVGRSGLSGLDPFLGTISCGLSSDFERERPRSNLGMRSLFVGNLPFHCQWQDLKDLFRQAGTILRADVSLGPDGRSRGFGTVSYANEIDAERAVAMFNGFDYNGRTLKVHYDKFSVQSPLPPNMSPHTSTLTTPVQPSASSTQATLLQAAQLQQLVSGETYDRYGNFSNINTSIGNNNTNVGNDGTSNGAATQTLGESLRALHDSLQMQSQVRSTMTGARAKAANEHVGTSTNASTSESSTSPLSHHLMGSSPSLAERRQKVPPPIASVSASSSRPGTSAGIGLGSANDRNTVLSGVASVADSYSASLASPTKNRRPAGQSLPSSSAPVTTATSGESSPSKRPATSSSVPTLASTSTSSSTSTQPSHSSSATSSASPRTSHPAHPGPIALPPPPSVTAFPLYSPHHHPLSPPGHPMSPLGTVYAGYPHYGPMSPMYPYPLPAHMHAHNMTPHGLPPITPSMPSFSFVPQPSPNVPVGGSSEIPPTPAEGGGPPPEGYPTSGQPGDSGNLTAMGMGVMSMMSPPLHLPHHVFQPFTPGAAMSPGAFYGRPNGAAPRGTYLNPAVGSPVLIHPQFGFPPPGSQPGSPYYQPSPNGGTYGEEPNGYFPPINTDPPPPRHEGYFPPMSALGSSGLANEILKGGSSMNLDGYEVDGRPARERNDSGSVPTSSENGPEEDTDAERARSTSSGATSWRSSENASDAATAGAGSGATQEGLARDMASVRLGPPPKSRNAKRGEASYAAAAAVDKLTSIQRTESVSSDDDVARYPPAARHLSMGSEGARRPAAPQKTHSDETRAHVRLNTEGVTTS